MVFQNLMLSLSSAVPKYHTGSCAKKAFWLPRKRFRRYSGRRAETIAASDTSARRRHLFRRFPARVSRVRKNAMRTNGTGDLMRQAAESAMRADAVRSMPQRSSVRSDTAVTERASASVSGIGTE